MLSFAPLTIDDRKRYVAFYTRCPEKCAQYSFFALWGWNQTDPAELAWTPDLCWIRCRGHREGLIAPVGDWSAVDWEDTFERHLNPGDVLLDVPEALIRTLPPPLLPRLEIAELRDEWEYVHSVSELVALKGGKYAHKRAHVRAFLGNYRHEYVPLLPEDFPELLAFLTEWYARRNALDDPLLRSEDLAIRRALEYWDVLPLTGAMLRVEGRVVACTIAEELSPDTLDIRFEKAFGDDYAGIYQALNCLFLERQGRSYHQVNREEDMGNPGLRDAKLSYHPDRFVKKYRIVYRGMDSIFIEGD